MRWLLMAVLPMTAAAAAASAQPVNYLMRPDVGRIDDAMRRVGEAETPSGSIAAGEIAGTMPFAFRRTGVTTTDSRDMTFYNPRVRIPAGSAGYMVTKFPFSGFMNYTQVEIWCFRVPKGDDAERLMCLNYRPGISNHIEVEERHWPRPKVANGNIFGTTGGPAPAIDERPVQIVPNPVLQYRFDGWSKAGAKVAFLVGGQVSAELQVRQGDDGSVALGLLDGSYLRLTRDPADVSRARSVFVAQGATYDKQTNFKMKPR